MIKIILEKIEVTIVAFEITDRAENQEFHLVQGDTYPPIKVTLLDSIEDPIDLTGYTIHFHFRVADSSTLINAGHTQCAILDAVNGIAQYNWGDSDTQNIGIHFGEFQIITPSGKKQTIPFKLRFNVRQEIDGVSGV